MDERLHIIFARRSIRRYTDTSISEADIDSLLQAGMAAPSAANLKPWHFYVVTDRKALQTLAEVNPYGKMLAQAGLAIAVCGDPSISDWWVQDCTAATENILIAATALGLGAVWLGFYPREERWRGAQRVLGIPERVIPLAVIALGQPAERKDPAGRFDRSFIHRDRW